MDLLRFFCCSLEWVGVVFGICVSSDDKCHGNIHTAAALYQISEHIVHPLTKKRKHKTMQITGKCPLYLFILSVEGDCSFIYFYQRVIPSCSLLATHMEKHFSSFLQQISLAELSIILSLSLTTL